MATKQHAILSASASERWLRSSDWLGWTLPVEKRAHKGEVSAPGLKTTLLGHFQSLYAVPAFMRISGRYQFFKVRCYKRLGLLSAGSTLPEILRSVIRCHTFPPVLLALFRFCLS
jgi:hypothetical protein